MRSPARPIPESHPVHVLFRRLTARGLAQVQLSESDLLHYLSRMLVRFVHIDGLHRLRSEEGAPLRYLSDMLARADEIEPSSKPEALRHVGDYALFVLGFYPESLTGRRKLVGPDYYAEQGRRSYLRANEMSRGTIDHRSAGHAIRWRPAILWGEDPMADRIAER